MLSFKAYLEELLFSGMRNRELQFQHEDEPTKERAKISIWRVDSEQELFDLEKKHQWLRGIALPDGNLYVAPAFDHFHIDILQYLQEPAVGELFIPKHPGKIRTWEVFDKYRKDFITLANGEDSYSNNIWAIGESQNMSNNQILIKLNKKFTKHIFLPVSIVKIDYIAIPEKAERELKQLIAALPKMYAPLQLAKRIIAPDLD